MPVQCIVRNVTLAHTKYVFKIAIVAPVMYRPVSLSKFIWAITNLISLLFFTKIEIQVVTSYLKISPVGTDQCVFVVLL